MVSEAMEVIDGVRGHPWIGSPSWPWPMVWMHASWSVAGSRQVLIRLSPTSRFLMSLRRKVDIRGGQFLESP
jgi:hypothetical protein